MRYGGLQLGDDVTAGFGAAIARTGRGAVMGAGSFGAIAEAAGALDATGTGIDEGTAAGSGERADAETIIGASVTRPAAREGAELLERH